MKIKELTIENFRIFNGEKKFNFGNKDLIVISGPNGNGKSTVFDSIQWCLTGKIPRYSGSKEHNKFDYMMNQAAVNDPSQGRMSVEVTFETEQGEVRVLRSQKKSKSGKLGTPKISVNGVEYATLSAGEDKIRDILFQAEIEEVDGGSTEKDMNLATFFSATQLLSQDSLHNFIREDKPTERYDLMDKVLGVRKYGGDFEEYITDVRKIIEAELDRLKKDKQDPESRLKTLDIQLSEKENQLKVIGDVREGELIDKVQMLINQVKQFGLSPSGIQLDIRELSLDILKELVAIRNDVSEESDRFNKLMMNLKSAKDLLDFSSKEYNEQRERLTNQQVQLNSKIQRRVKGVEIINHRKMNYEALKVRRISYQQTTRFLRDLEDRVRKIEEEENNVLAHPSVMEIKDKYLELTAFVAAYEKCQLEQVGLLTFLKYQELDEAVKNLEKSLTDDTSRMNSCESLLQAKQLDLRQINYELEKIGVTTEAHKESVVHQLIHQVQSHLLETEGDNECPVCGTKFESIHSLHQVVRLQIEKGNQVLSMLEQQERDFTSKKNLLEAEINGLQAEYLKLNSNCEEKRKLINRTIVEREKVRTNIPVVLIDCPVYEVKQKKIENELFINRYQMVFDLLKSLDQNKAAKEQFQQQKALHLSTLETFKQESARWSIYLELEEIEIDKKLQKIQRYQTKVDEELKRNAELKDSLTSKNVALDLKWELREERIRKIREDIAEFTGTKEDFEQSLVKIHSQISQRTQWDLEMGTHLSKIQAFLSKDQIAELRNQVKSLWEVVRSYDGQIQKCEKFLTEDLIWLRERHISVQSKLIGDYLLQHSEFIDQLFMQISPHAVYRHVQLVPKDKNLYVVMTKTSAKENDLRQLSEEELKKQFNASLTFSSAQSNVLAVCIFLALNLSQKWTKLRLLGIDDPFQNLDDINAFSFADVLSQIVSNQQKQVLISTHSEDFAHLLRVKMGLGSEKIGTIIFQAYNESGVSVAGNCLIH